jgi:YfiR/HmsC-like
MMKVRLGKRNDRLSALAGSSVARADARRIPRAFSFIIVCWLFFNVFPDAVWLNGESVEYPVKLAFLYNFTKFVEWPADSYSSPGAPLSICIVGHDPFNRDLEGELRTRKTWGRPVEVRTLRPVETLNTCHMVFIPVTEKDEAGKIVRSLKGSSTLTVGETAGFAAMGGVINLTVEKSEVHFEINKLAADRAHLKISSKLLSLAKLVTERDPGGY